jgi:hypothetical protein
MNLETQQCKECDIYFRSMGDRRQHERSFKHQRKLGLIPPLPVCEVCNVTVKDTTRHLMTVRHRRRIQSRTSLEDHKTTIPTTN